MELSSKQIEQFNKDGYIIFPELFTSDEIEIFKKEVDRVSKIRSEMVVREGEDEAVKIMFLKKTLRQPHLFRTAARSPRILRTAQQCLGDEELYLHHSKLNMKSAIEGSAWPWHQDFHSWHLDGIKQPEMVTVTVVLTEASPINGCMYVLPGSHKQGRSDPRWDDSTAYKLWVAKTSDMKEYMKSSPPLYQLPEERVQLQYSIVIYYMLLDIISHQKIVGRFFSASINAQTDRSTSKTQGQNMSVRQIGVRCKLAPI